MNATEVPQFLSPLSPPGPPRPFSLTTKKLMKTGGEGLLRAFRQQIIDLACGSYQDFSNGRIPLLYLRQGRLMADHGGLYSATKPQQIEANDG
jgi:hypothetical protein